MAEKKAYRLDKAVLNRFLRTYLPQVPAAVVYVLEVTKRLDLPGWVVPVLMFVGAVATALDKLFRELEWY